MDAMVSPPVAETARASAALGRVRDAMAAGEHETVSIYRIRPFAGQPRTHFDKKKLAELTESIRQSGQLVEGCLRRVKPDKRGRDLELVDGERRWRACLDAGVTDYRAVVISVAHEDAQFLISAAVNFNRAGHTTQEMVMTIRHLHESLKFTLAEIGKLMGYHPLTIGNFYSMRHLVPEVWSMLDPERPREQQISASAGSVISRLREKNQLAVANKVVSGELSLVALKTMLSTEMHAGRGEGGPIDRSGDAVSPSGKYRRPRASDPFYQRRAIERRVRGNMNAMVLMRDLLKATAPEVVRGWLDDQMETVRNDAKRAIAAGQDFLTLLDSVERARRTKTPTQRA